MTTVLIGGSLFHFVDDGRGETILFLHGNVASTRWWLPTFERLPNRFHAIALDMLGYGLSDKPGVRYGIAERAADLHAFIAALQLKRVHLVGHSLGAVVALQYALAYPSVAGSLTLLDTAPLTGLRSNFITYSAIPILIQNRMLFEQALRPTAPTGPFGDPWDRIVDDGMLADPRAWRETYQSLQNWNLEQQARTLNVPVLIVHGADDILVPVEHVQRAARIIPRARIIVMQRTGHSANIERPDEWTRHLVQFLSLHRF